MTEREMVEKTLLRLGRFANLSEETIIHAIGSFFMVFLSGEVNYHIHFLYHYTCFDQRRVDIIDQVEVHDWHYTPGQQGIRLV